MSQNTGDDHKHEQERQHHIEVENATRAQFQKLEHEYSRDFGDALFMQAREIFMQLDVDDSGIIDLGDVEAYMAAEGWHVPDNLEQQFRAADKDGDGGLDVEEFLFFLAEAVNSGQSPKHQASVKLASDDNFVEFRRSSRNTILLQSAQEEVEKALKETDVEREHNMALQEIIHKRETRVLHLDDQVTILRTSLESTSAELDEVLQQLRAAELAQEALQAKFEEQAEELKLCRRELEDLRGSDEDADEDEGGHSKKLSIQALPFQTRQSTVGRRSCQSDVLVGDSSEVLQKDPTERLSVRSSKSMLDELEQSMLQCDKLQTTVDMMSTECTLLRCLAEWRLHVSECRKDSRAASSEAELQKLSGAATGLVREVKKLGEHIAAVAPSLPTESVAPRISEATGRGLVLRCQLATLQQQCRDWHIALLEAIPLEAKPPQEEQELALFRGRLSNGSVVDELQVCMRETEPEVVKNGSKGPSLPTEIHETLQLFCRFLQESDQKVRYLEATISNMETLRRLQYGLG